MASKLRKILAGLAFLMILFVFALPVIFRIDQETGQSKDESKPDYNLTDVTLVGHNQGEKQWQLEVLEVKDKGKDITQLNGLKDGKVFQNGLPRYYLAATNGEYNRDKDEFLLNDQVLITGTDGETIKASGVRFNNERKQLSSGSVSVDLSREQTQVLASQMAIDVQNEVYEFTGGVEVDFPIGEEDEEEAVGDAEEEGTGEN